MKNPKLFIVVLLLFCGMPFNAKSQVINNLNYMWSRSLNSNNTTIVNDTKVDLNGNIYVYGEFNGTYDFNPLAGVDNKTAVGGYDVYLSKYDILGNYLWTVTFGGTGSESAADGGLEVDPSGLSLYLVGEFTGTVDFDPGATIENKTSLGATDVFFCKYTTAGVYSFTKTIGGGGPDDVGEVKMHGGGIVLCGRFNGTVDFDPNAGVVNFVSNGTWDQYLLKLSATGVYTWLRQWDLHSDRENLEIRTDAGGNIYMFGEFFMTNTDIDPGAGTVLISSANISQGNLFYLKLNSGGNYVLSATYNIPTTEVSFFIDAGSNLHVSLKSYGVINAGTISATTNGVSSGVLLKLSNNGTVLLSTLLDNAGADSFGVMDKVTDNGSVYFYVLAGTSSGALGLSAGTHVVKYDLNHTFVFNETFSSQFPVILCVDGGGGVVISGTFTSTANFDFNGTQNMTTSGVYYNMFVSRYDSYTNLPVEIVSMNLECEEGGNYLKWVTSSEYNSNRFEINGSYNGEQWEYLNDVAAMGYSSQNIEYSYEIDRSLDYMYYRIVQIDNNGENKVYPIISYNCQDSRYILYPNPNEGIFVVNIGENVLIGDYLIIKDLTGREVYRKEISGDSKLLYVEKDDLIPGVYVLIIEDDNSQGLKFVVN